MRFTGRTFLMRFWLILGMFPGFLTMICLYFLLKQFGLTQAGAIPGLILVSVASSGMGYYVCKGYFDTIPKALDEAAMIDGATRARIFFTMVIPMSKPIIIYTALVAFMAPWCDYVFASYVAFGHDTSYNVAVGMTRWVWTNDYQGYFTRFCAGGVLVAIPVTLLFMFLQKYYVEGVTGGAVKG
jgi:arabinogalactan oligomer/maltooligosaccharide transport system permease protein